MGLFGDLARQFANEVVNELLSDDDEQQVQNTEEPEESDFAHQLHGLNTQEILSLIEHPSVELQQSTGYDEVRDEMQRRIIDTGQYNREDEEQGTEKINTIFNEIKTWTTPQLQAYLDDFEEADPMTLLCVQEYIGSQRHVNRFMNQGGSF